MKTRLRLLNVLLMVACGFIAWQMRANHIQHQERLDRVFSVKTAQAPSEEVAVEPLPKAPSASEYSEVAMRMVFAQDRNPNVVEEKKPEPEPKKMPELPILLGVMNLGDGMVAMMSETSGGAQRAYSVNESIGEFKILKIAPEQITFEWDGKELVKKASELRAKGEKPARAAKPVVQEAKAAAPKPAPAPVKAGPGKDLGGDFRACVVGDTTAVGTVVDGYKKKIAKTPMGNNCLWEKVE